MTREETKQHVRDSVEIKPARVPNNGGQQTNGNADTTMVLHSKYLDLKMELGHYRTRVKNKELLNVMFELVMDEIINL